MRRWLLAAVGAIPLLIIYPIHFSTPGAIATGFLQFDQPTYMANGRAAFERGNGLAYPNPYDFTADTPAIYFHLPMWFLGAGVYFFDFEPGWWYAAWGIVFGLITAYLTLLLVEQCLGPDARHPYIVYLMAMWGGGLFVVAEVFDNIVNGYDLLFGLVRLDPGNGFWFQNWGRNIVYATEATYHALVVWCWLSVLKRRWSLMLISAALLAASHPFTGAQLLAVLITWGLVGWLLRLDDRIPDGAVLALHGMACAFAGYYFVFLNRFAQHREIVAVWRLPQTLDPEPMALAYLPIASLAAARLWIDRRRLTSATYFWCVAFLVAFLLAKHEWFIAAHQPLHFTRGYLWLPLFLLAAPLLDAAVDWFIRPAGLRAMRLALGVVFALFVAADNIGFVIEYAKNRAQWGVFLTAAEHDILRSMDRHSLHGVLVCPIHKLNSLAPVYAGVSPIYGHDYNTPDMRERQKLVKTWFANGSIPQDYDLALVERARRPAFLNESDWRIVHENAEFILFQRK